MAIVVMFPDPLKEGVSGECRGEGADGILKNWISNHCSCLLDFSVWQGEL